jgi:hypothetical protein
MLSTDRHTTCSRHTFIRYNKRIITEAALLETPKSHQNWRLKKRKWRGNSERHLTLWEETENVPALKVPMYCSLGSDKVKRWEVAFFKLGAEERNWTGSALRSYGRAAAFEACNATWNLGASSSFAPGSRQTKQSSGPIGRSQDLPESQRLKHVLLIIKAFGS